MTDDDGFGPVQRGGGYSPRGGVIPPKPRARSKPDAYADHGPEDRPQAAGDGFGPSHRGKARRVRLPHVRRVLKTILVLLLVAVLAVLGIGVAAGVSANSQIDRIDVDGLNPAGGGQRNILLIGSDSREDLTRRQRRRLGTGGRGFEGTRTDTILLLSIRGGQAAMLSFPRDLYVRRCDGSAGRINAAYGIDGASCLVQTVSDVSGIPVSHYMEIDFLGFHDIVQAVGGVRMCLDRAISDRDAHIDLPKGCQRLNGREALGFVRVRKIDDDLGRIGRQQRFVKELAKEIAQPSTVLNPPRLFATGNAVGSALTANEQFGLIDLAALARAGVGISRSDFPTLAVPGTPAFAGGASIINLDEAAAEPIFRSFRDGSVLTEQNRQLQPSDVALEVRNGTSVSGLANRVADAMRDAGFDVTAVGNSDPVKRTVVRYTTGNRAEAQFVAEQVPLAGDVRVREASDGPPVLLLLGEDAADGQD